MRTPSRSRPTSHFRFSPLVAALAGVLAHDAMAACTPVPPPSPTPVFCVTNTANSGAGSLRQAVTDATNPINCGNTNATIGFAIPTGPFSISVPTPINASCFGSTGPFNLTIDGTSQTGFVANTSSTDFNGTNVIELNGNNISVSGGLQFNAFSYGGALTLKGIDLRNFNYGGCATFNPTTIVGGVNIYGSRFANNCLSVDAETIDANGSLFSGGEGPSRIGSLTPAERNVFESAINASVQVAYGGRIHVEGNLIGTDGSGAASGGGTGHGVRVIQNNFNSSAQILNNIIAGNGGSGIHIDFGSTGVGISGNKIGVGVGGAALGNAIHGIHSTNTNSTVDVINNTIANNALDGIYQDSGLSHNYRANRIYANGRKAINFTGTAAQLANDTNDADAGPNGLQNFPIINSVVKNATANTTTVNWSLNSETASTFEVDFFTNPVNSAIPQATVYLDPSLYGFTQPSNSTGAGNSIFATTTIQGLHDWISATATLMGPDNTSEVNGEVAARGLSMSPTTLTFPATVVNSTSAAQATALTSLGAGPVTLSYIGESAGLCYGGSPACTTGAFVCSTTCATSTPYAAGPACTFTATFQPLTLGTHTTTVNFCDNADAQFTPRVLTLTGNAIAPPPVTAMPTSHDFGNIEIGASSGIFQFTFSNPGPTPATLSPFTVTGPYTIVANGCTSSLSPSAGCLVDVRFNPTVVGPASGVLSTTAGPGGATALLGGTGVFGPPPTITPPSIDMGSVIVGQSAATPGTFTLTNPAVLPLSISGITANPPFSIAAGGNCGTSLAGGGTCNINVGFTPAAVGAVTGAMNVATGGGTYSGGLSGTGTAQPPVTISPPNADFGTVFVGFNSTPVTFTITNPGPGSQTLSSFSVTPPFSLLSTTCVSALAAATSCTADVKFSPTATGAMSGTLSATSGTGPLTSALTGNGTAAPALQIAPGAHDFGTVLVGQASGPMAFTITNPAPLPTSLSALSVSGPYEIVSTTCTTSLSASGSCAANVRFVPVASGLSAGSLSASSGFGAASASLTGAGQRAPALSVSSSSVDFGSLIVGSAPVSRPVTLSNTGNAIMGINSVSVAPPFTLSNGCGVSLAEGASCIATVNFNPATIGDFTGLLTIGTNAPGATQVQIGVRAGVQARPEPLIRVLPRSIGFGNRVSTVPGLGQPVTISNEGGATASLNFALQMPHFSFSRGTCGATLAPQQSCEASVSFEPTGFGPKRGTFEVSSNSPDSPQRVELSGVGCRPFPPTPGRGTSPLNCSP